MSCQVYSYNFDSRTLENLDKQSGHYVWLFCWKNYITLDLIIIKLLAKDRAESILHKNPAGEIAACMNSGHLV